MNKLRKGMGFVLMMALLITSFIGVKQTVAFADGEVNVRFHYVSSDGKYDDKTWSLTVIGADKLEQHLFFDDNGTAKDVYTTSDTTISCYVKDVAKSKELNDNGGTGFIRDDGSDNKMITIDFTGKTGDVDVYLSYDSNEAKFEADSTTVETSAADISANPAAPTVKETTTSSKDNDVSAASIVISDVLVLIAVAAGIFFVLGKEKKPVI